MILRSTRTKKLVEAQRSLRGEHLLKLKLPIGGSPSKLRCFSKPTSQNCRRRPPLSRCRHSARYGRSRTSGMAEININKTHVHMRQHWTLAPANTHQRAPSSDIDCAKLLNHNDPLRICSTCLSTTQAPLLSTTISLRTRWQNFVDDLHERRPLSA